MRWNLAALAALLVPLVAPLPAAQGSECSGPLAASVRQVQVAYTLAPPPEGHIYATQPNVDPAAGDGVPVNVTVVRDGGCAVPSAGVTVQAREDGQADFRDIRSGTTNQQGYALFTLKPVRRTEVRAVAAAAEESTSSSAITLAVRRSLSATYGSGGGCTLTATGRVYPRSFGVPVWLQRRIVRDGRETGFVTLTTGTTGRDGVYSLRHAAPCGADYALATYSPAAAGTSAGRGLLVDLHVVASR